MMIFSKCKYGFMPDSQKNLEGSLPHSLHFLIANIQKRIKNCNYGENSKNLQRLNELTTLPFYFLLKTSLLTVTRVIMARVRDSQRHYFHIRSGM